MMLDATAGNRMMWKKNKFNFNALFLDKEINLKVPPNIIADNRKLPFRGDVFDCVVFDPPHFVGSIFPWMNDPKYRSFYSQWKSKIECFSSISKSQKEFARVSSRLCFKWNDISVSL